MFWKKKQKPETPKVADVVKPPDDFISETVNGIKGVYGLPYQYVNWAYEYLGHTPEVTSTAVFFKMEYVWMFYEACLVYTEAKENERNH